MAKMGPKLMTLCSAAIGAVYLTGFYVTDSADPALTHPEINKNSIKAADKSIRPIPEMKNQTQQAPAKTYKDGTFTGQGFNHIGSVEVAVTLHNDHITKVEIKNCDTHYSESYIEDLPNEVIMRQSPNVDIVSGATRSTEDFQTAVEQALQQAKI